MRIKDKMYFHLKIQFIKRFMIKKLNKKHN
jgi:hypothetical protein